MIIELQNQLQMFQNELIQKNLKLHQVEDEFSNLRIKYGQYDHKIQSYITEINELQGAMSSLHAELSIITKELNDKNEENQQINQKNQLIKQLNDKQILEIKKLQNLNEKLEKQQNETIYNLKLQNNESNKKIETLLLTNNELNSLLKTNEMKIKQQFCFFG